MRDVGQRGGCETCLNKPPTLLSCCPLQVSTYQERLMFAEQEARDAQAAAAEKASKAKEVGRSASQSLRIQLCGG